MTMVVTARVPLEAVESIQVGGPRTVLLGSLSGQQSPWRSLSSVKDWLRSLMAVGTRSHEILGTINLVALQPLELVAIMVLAIVALRRRLSSAG